MNRNKKIQFIDYPLLEFNNITVIKGENKKVLDAISITINKGENTAILGPNGAGKSSLIKTITREYYPLSYRKDFSFKILGQERWNIFDLRSLLGIVSNDLQFTFTRDITGLEVVLSGFFSSVGLFKEHVNLKMKKKACEVIDFLKIAHLASRKISEMSSGEARRFLIGRALVHNPKALILDEPANSLDLYALYRFSDILRKIAESGISIILVTQNLNDIIPEIKRVILMKDGKFFKDGPKEKILNNKNISNLFSIPVEIKQKDGYYYALRAVS
ncbi:MAG: ATP-binding cassette domain-containing protein [Candidatus Omnitrophota bacterium]